MTYQLPTDGAVRRPSTAWRVVRLVLAALLGVLVATIGTVMFQAVLPVGLVLALAATVAGAVTARAWSGFGTFGAYAVGWVVAVQVLAAKGPGGDVLVPGGRDASYLWVYGGLVLVALASFAPRSWFAAEPRRARSVTGADAPQQDLEGPGGVTPHP